jgi:xanthine dehydrogenase YagS FAD-binding subunit
LTNVAAIGRDEFIQSTYLGLALPAQTIATPQIREMATLGGALAQRNRCWYYRNPQFNCFKKGGDDCPARKGNHHFGVCLDLGPCVAPHPSSIGLALLNYGAYLEVYGKGRISVKDFFGDGSDPSNDHILKSGELITHIVLPTGVKQERAAYFRLMSRSGAEWPIVEVVVLLVMDGEAISDVRLAMNGVANIPMRLPKVESILKGEKAVESVFRRAAEVAGEGANPLPMTAYKLEMMKASVFVGLSEALRNKNGESK